MRTRNGKTKVLLAAACLSAALSCGGALAAPAPASAVEGAEHFTVGAIDVTAIVDRKTVFSQTLFEGVEAYPEMLALLPDGKSDGVVRSFLVRTGEHLALIDTGYGAAAGGATLEILERLGVAPESVTDVLLTHLDGDHIGGLVKNGRAVFPKAVVRLSRDEYEAWIVRGDGRAAKSIEKAREVLGFYKDRIEVFDFEKDVLPGVKARDARGHTPGHTRFDMESQGSKFVVFGDLLHAYPLQASFPAMSSKYDQDPKMAAETRARVLDELVESGVPAAGMHLSPMGVIEKQAEGFAFKK